MSSTEVTGEVNEDFLTMSSTEVFDSVETSEVNEDPSTMSSDESSDSSKFNGFLAPMYVTNNLRRFFFDANLGPASIKQPDGTFIPGDHIRNYLYLLLWGRGISSSGLLTPLFSLYARVNKIQDPEDQRFLQATPLMIEHFGEIFNQLPFEDQQYLSAQKERLANLIKNGASKSEIDHVQRMVDNYVIFDPNHFKYHRFQSIIVRNCVPKAQLSVEQLQYLKEPEVRLQLDEEQRIVSSTLEWYRTKDEEVRKEQRLVSKILEILSEQKVKIRDEQHLMSKIREILSEARS